MQWASALSTAADLDQALAQVMASIDAQLGSTPPDLVFVFAMPSHRDAAPRLPALIRDRWHGVAVMGSSAGGVLAEGREVENGAAICVSAAVLPGVEVRTFHFTADTLPPPERDTWRERLDVEHDPHFVVVPDPFTCDPGMLIRSLDGAFPDRTKVGGLASGFRQPGEAILIAGESVYTSGVVGVSLGGNIHLDAVVCQGCRPVGSPLFVTRSERNVIHELDGRPPSEAVQELYDHLPASDQELLRTSLFIGLVMTPAQEIYRQGDFLVRNIVGLDPRGGALAIGAEVNPNTVVQFHLRDAETSASDIEAMLGRYVASPEHTPAGALLFSCLGRGESLYGQPDHDSRTFGRIIGPVPLGGFFGNGELGPIAGTTHVHGYTSSFGLFSPLRVD